MDAVISYAAKALFQRPILLSYGELIKNSGDETQKALATAMSAWSADKSKATVQNFKSSLQQFANYLSSIGIHRFDAPDLADRVDFDDFKDYLESADSHSRWGTPRREKLTPPRQLMYYRRSLEFCDAFLHMEKARETLRALSSQRRPRSSSFDEMVKNSSPELQGKTNTFIISLNKGKGYASVTKLISSLNQLADFSISIGIDRFDAPAFASRIKFEEVWEYLTSVKSYQSKKGLSAEVQDAYFQRILEFCDVCLHMPEAHRLLNAKSLVKAARASDRANATNAAKPERPFYNKIFPRFSPDQKKSFVLWQQGLAKTGDATANDFNCSLNHFANFPGLKDIDRFDTPDLAAKIDFKKLWTYCQSIKNYSTGKEVIPLRQRRHYLRMLEFCADFLKMREAKAAWLAERGRRKRRRNKRKRPVVRIQNCKSEVTKRCSATHLPAIGYAKYFAFSDQGTPPSEVEARLLLKMLELLDQPRQRQGELVKKIRKSFGGQADPRRAKLHRMGICNDTKTAELNAQFIGYLNIPGQRRILYALAEKYRHYLANRALNYSRAAAAASTPAPWMFPRRPNNDPPMPKNSPAAQQRPRP